MTFERGDVVQTTKPIELALTGAVVPVGTLAAVWIVGDGEEYEEGSYVIKDLDSPLAVVAYDDEIEYPTKTEEEEVDG